MPLHPAAADATTVARLEFLHILISNCHRN
jgi:hypothetical protein